MGHVTGMVETSRDMGKFMGGERRASANELVIIIAVATYIVWRDRQGRVYGF